MTADRGARQHHRPVTQPGPGADAHRLLGHHLLRDRAVEVLVPMVLVGDVDVVAGPHVVVDLDRQVADDPAAPTDQAARADADGIGHAHLTGHHPGGQEICGPISVRDPMWM